MFVKDTSIGKNDLACLEAVISGGDYMSDVLKQKIDASLKEHGSNAEVRIGYGLTEASAATCLTPTGKYKSGSIGIQFPDTDYFLMRAAEAYLTFAEADTRANGGSITTEAKVAIDAIRNIDRTILEYSPSAGYRSYREKLVGYYDKFNIKLTADDIIISEGLFQDIGHTDQHLVAKQMTMLVIDSLEVVQVDDQHGAASFPSGLDILYLQERIIAIPVARNGKRCYTIW